MQCKPKTYSLVRPLALPSNSNIRPQYGKIFFSMSLMALAIKYKTRPCPVIWFCQYSAVTYL